MPASVACQRHGQVVVMALGLLSLACWDADASPMSVMSPSENGAVVDLRLDRSMAGVGGIARWEIPTDAQVAAPGRPDQPELSSEMPQAAGTAVAGSMSFPDAPGGFTSQPAMPTLPEHASRETLKDVLRSIATIHRPEVRLSVTTPFPRRTALAASDDAAEDVTRSQRAGLAEVLLDSEIAGAMLRSLVTVKSSDSGATFAILGAGDFVLDVSPGAHAAHITELSSGASLGTSSNYSVYSDYTASSGEGRMVVGQRVNVVRVIWEWCLDNIFSPTGVLLSTIIMIVLFFWRLAKAVDPAQRGRGR